MNWIADAAAGAGDETLKTVLAVLGWVTSFAVAVIGALHLKNAKSAAKTEGKAEGLAQAQMIGPQPFIVQLREQFATRHELEKLEATMNGHVAEMKSSALATTTEMKGLFRETMAAVATDSKATNALIERRHKAVMEEVGKVASGAYTGRQKIWEVVNPMRVEIGAIQATQDVSAQIEKLADALEGRQTKVQPTHTTNG